ncbi:MAG: hypothetical protein HKM94_03955, partial [Halobacteria archaeon]|nr:hypothetical protein [Halobacteria archaeon]
MKNASFYNDLIHAIENLYSSITLQILQKRMNTYHQAPSTDNYTEHALDIKAPLFKYIDDISSNDQKTVTEVQTLDYSFFSQTTHQHTSTHSELTSQRIVIKENNSGLSKHFNTKHNDAEYHPGIDEKLKHSIWEHIHASIRHARLGDARVAKVHADIANSAYKELAHYVSSEAHTEFALEIEDQLDVLLKNK